jgi:hypothetical protein
MQIEYVTPQSVPVVMCIICKCTGQIRVRGQVKVIGVHVNASTTYAKPLTTTSTNIYSTTTILISYCTLHTLQAVACQQNQ